MAIICSIIFGLISLLLFFVAFIILIRGSEKTSSLLSLLASLFSCIITVIAGFNISISEPEIFPSNGETKICYDKEEITLISDEGYTIYYTLDGSDPKQGIKYEKPFMLTETKTVSARAKFLFWWSSVTKSIYLFKEKDEQVSTPTPTPTPTPVSVSTPTPTPVSVSVSTPTPTPVSVSTPTPTPVLSPYPTVDSIESTVEPTSVPTLSPTEIPTSTGKPLPPYNLSGWLNLVESTKLVDCINRYRKNANIKELLMDEKLEEKAEILAISSATGYEFPINYIPENMGIINNESDAMVVADNWMTENSVWYNGGILYSEKFRYIGCAVYYSPEGTEDGFHYFWYICLQ